MRIKDLVASRAITLHTEQIGGPTHRERVRAKLAGTTLPNENQPTEWKVWLRRYGVRTSFLTTFTMGAAHKGTPNLLDVLDCLRSDCASIEDTPAFEEWAASLGYDTDSRKAEAVWRTCLEQSALLRGWMGREMYDVFIQCESE